MSTRRKAARPAASPKKSARFKLDFKTEQEAFWAGQFGDDYINRNADEDFIASNSAMFARILRSTAGVKSAIEFGANVGLNLRALRLLAPNMRLEAVEINAKAVGVLRKIKGLKVHHRSILDFEPQQSAELSFSKGVLIHIAPEKLARAYQALYRASSRYICVAEYYNPVPISIPYRGHSDRLFKRDFAGDLLDRYRDLRLVDYGFVYRGDPMFRQDDLTWFLLEKS